MAYLAHVVSVVNLVDGSSIDDSLDVYGLSSNNRSQDGLSAAFSTPDALSTYPKLLEHVRAEEDQPSYLPFPSVDLDHVSIIAIFQDHGPGKYAQGPEVF